MRHEPDDTELTARAEYRAFVDAMARDCRCCPECSGGEIPCAGVLAGGLCDRMCRCRDEDFGDEEPDDG